MPTTAFCRPSSSRHDALGPLRSGDGGPIGTPCAVMKSRNRRRAWSRRSWPSRSSVRSTSDEIEKPISPPNTTAYSVVRLCSPTMWLLNSRADLSAASRTGPALPSPITASRFFIVHPAREAPPHPEAADVVLPIIHYPLAHGESGSKALAAAYGMDPVGAPD